MKIFLNHLNESWVVDRFRKEWIEFNENCTTEKIKDADIIWIIAPWTWSKLPKKYLKNKKVVCSIYHIDEDKFSEHDQKDFTKRDKYINEYHVISQKTRQQLMKLTQKPITSIPFWINPQIWFKKDEQFLRKKYNLKKDSFLIGSFQRDTEGSDLISPKLSKGPDLFLEIVREMYEDRNNIEIVLTGKRRNYLKSELTKLKIPFYYFEMVDFEDLNNLYNCLDLYIVASRYEGGPQSILECAITKTPIISSRVGVSEEILSEESLFDMDTFSEATPDTDYAYRNIENLILPKGFDDFMKLFNKINEN